MHTTNYLRIKEQIEAAKISTQKVEYFKSLRNVERFFIITAIGFYLSLPFLLKNLEVELYFAKYQSLIEHFKIKNTQGASFSTVFPQYIKTLPEWMIPPVVTKFFSGGSLSENEKSELRKFLELSGNVKVTGDLKSVIENSLSERPDKTFLRYRNKSIIEYINKNNLLWNAGEFSLGDFQKKVKSAISLPDPKYCTESSSLDKGVERCTIFLDAYLSFSRMCLKE